VEVAADAARGRVGRLWHITDLGEEKAMTQNASVTVTGYVAMEPKLVLTKVKQTPVVNLRVATTYRRIDTQTGEWRELGTSFFTVNCWNRLAYNVAASLRKGDPVIVRGRLKSRAWNDNGATRTVHEIEADAIGHDIAYGWSHFMRGTHPQHQGMLAALGGGRVDGAGPVPGGQSDAERPSDGFADDRSFADDGSFADDVTFADDRSFTDDDDDRDGRLPDDGDPVSEPGLTDLPLPEEPDALTPAAGYGLDRADVPQADDLAAESVSF
jgi:single-strand DNA-binding protein